MTRRAKRLATYEHGTYILQPTDTRPYRVVSFDPATRRQHERTAHTEDDARHLARRFEAFRAAHGAVGPTERTVADLAEATIKGLVEMGREDSYIDRTEGLLKYWVVPTIGHVRVANWRPRDCEAVLAAATGQVGHERLKGLRAAMRAMVTRGQKDGWIPLGDAYDPLWKVTVVGAKAMDEPIDRSLLPTITECEKMEMALAEVLGDDWGLGLRLVRESMVRWGEFIALRPECFRFCDSDGDLLRAVALSQAIAERKGRFKVKDLKNHHNRTTSFGSDIAVDLEAFVARANPTERLFLRPDGKTPDRSWWSRRWRKALLIAGFTGSGWTIHTWRHVGACVWLFDRKADPAAVASAIGHSSVAFTLKRYTGARGAVARTLTLASE
jgi:hypothetical protein